MFLIFLVKLKDGSFYLSVHCMCKQAFPSQYESTISNQEISTSTRTALLSFKWAEWKHTKWGWVLNSGWHICKGPDRQTRFLSNVYENWESHRVWRYPENKGTTLKNKKYLGPGCHTLESQLLTWQIGKLGQPFKICTKSFQESRKVPSRHF